MKAAEKFYTSLGWGVQPWPESPTPYDMWTIGNKRVGGVMTIPEGMRANGTPPHWLPYVRVRDVDVSTAQAISLGGRVHRSAADIPAVGRFAVVEDPGGGTIALFTPQGDAAGTGDPQLGEFAWHEMGATNLETVWDFYVELFEWERVSEFDMGAMGPYRMFGKGGERYGGMYRRADESKASPYWLSYVAVSDAGSFADIVTANGGVVMTGPMDVPGGDRVVVFRDPQSAVCAAHQRRGG